MQLSNLCRRFLGILGVSILIALSILLAITIYNSQRTQTVVESADTVKIQVEETGLHEIALEDLQAFNRSLKTLSPEHLKLSQDGVSIPFLIEEDRLYFYGISPDSRYAPYRPYLLSFTESGFLMERSPISDSGESPIDTITDTLHLEENNLYDSRSIKHDDRDLEEMDPWYWETIQNDGELSVGFELEDVDEQASAVLRTAFYGATSIGSVDPDHDVNLSINGILIDSITWDGETSVVADSVIKPGILHSGANTLLIDNHPLDQGDADQSELNSSYFQLDIVRFDWADIEYRRTPEAIEDLLAIHSSEGFIEIGGYSGEPFVVDITDPMSPSLVEGWLFQDGNLELSIESDSTLLAVGPGGMIRKAQLSGVRDTVWRDTSNQADLIILTTDELSSSLSPLTEWREEQGLNVVLLTAEDVFNEFGAGENSPESISSFIEYALTKWEDPKPSYVLLVGEASYDYRDYLGQLGQNVIPAPMVLVDFGGETVSDSRLADADQDGMPDIAIGRWPVNSTRQVDELVKRTIAYEQGTANQDVLLVADGTSQEFISLSEEVLAGSGLPEAGIHRIYGEPADRFTEAWNNGAWLVSYSGHGSIDRWGKENVLSADAIPDLNTKGSPPIVLQLTCLTGFYAHPTVDSISELMLLDEDGPVEIIAATSLTLSSSQRPFGVNLIMALQNPDNERIGDAMQQAKLALDVTQFRELVEISETFTLLGDPSALILRPQ